MQRLADLRSFALKDPSLEKHSKAMEGAAIYITYTVYIIVQVAL